ncbi:hypothetical protein, partial [Mesorhizobium sp.]|uniref:hypothetical protein n=1 Tax=Mesorhizobium sp. TaxID=1871066 RepID=UPI0025BC4FE5
PASILNHKISLSGIPLRFCQKLNRSSAFHRFTEPVIRPISLFSRDSGRKTAHTFPEIALATGQLPGPVACDPPGG